MQEMLETQVQSLDQEDPLVEEMNLLHFSCLEGPMDSLPVYSPWGHKELDTTEHTQQKYLPRLIKRINMCKAFKTAFP